MPTGRRRALSPAAVMALTLVIASLFVGARWVVAADGDISRFVVAGSEYVSPDAGIAVEKGRGYDGQFSYRLAVDPTELERRANGVVLDSPIRLQRITYPVLAFAMALGQRPWVPAALVLVNVLALGLLALLSSVIAREHGRSPLAGLLLAGYFGFFTTLGRDLTEIVTVLLLLGGFLSWQRQRPGAAAVLFSAAVVSRESALLLYVAFAAAELARRRDRRSLLAAVPVAVFVAWQAVCTAVVGEIPLFSSSGKNLVLPLQDLLPAAAGWVEGAAELARQDLINLVQLGTLAGMVGCAAVALRTSRAQLGIKLAWAVALLLVASLSANVWIGPADFRTAAELHALSALIVLRSDLSLRLPAVLLGGAALMTALFRITSL